MFFNNLRHACFQLISRLAGGNSGFNFIQILRVNLLETVFLEFVKMDELVVFIGEIDGMMDE